LQQQKNTFSVLSKLHGMQISAWELSSLTEMQEAGSNPCSVVMLMFCCKFAGSMFGCNVNVLLEMPGSNPFLVENL
jgi:hypothetical protein